VNDVINKKNKANGNAEEVRPFTDNLADSFQLELQVCPLLFNDQVFIIPYPREIGHGTDSADNSLSFTLHDLTVREECKVGILLVIVNFKAHIFLGLLIVKIVVFRLLLDHIVAILAINALIYYEIQFLNYNAVGGHSITLLNLNHVANNQFTDWN